ncbi:hypothetical protein EI94DRAFT_704071 [Lactarius quietus]|nr:hypothetical protein EI94DRAFT_704071 [Lactarius quietus]
MGKSAKVHKRTVSASSPYGTVPHTYACTHSSQRKIVSGASLTTPSSKPAPVAQASAAKKKASKGRAKRPRPSGTGGSGPVLGGADYVDILLGSRRREREEAQKLPRDSPA